MNSATSNLGRNPGTSVLTLSALFAAAALTAHATDRYWSGGTGSFTNAAAWTGGIVPGATDAAINDNGANNVVQINIGNPDWALSQLRAGNSTGNGAFEQNGQTLSLTGAPRAFRLGIASGRLGLYTLNDGTINYTNGGLNVGELGQGILNINGGSISGSGNLAVCVGSSLDGVTATVDGSTNKSGFTWFEQGFYTADVSRGVPAAGSTFTNESQADHSYTMAPNYAGNSAVMIDTNVPSATITLASPAACSALSFLGSAGNGPVTVNYTVHHADSTAETGSLAVPDWFATDAVVAWRAGGRVPANGLGFQIINDGPNFPYLLSLDIALTNTASPVTSINLAYVSGGVACLLAVSGSSGGNFTPMAITGYNEDMILEAGAPIYASSTVTNTLTQTAGTIDLTGELWVGNYGVGLYNLSGGTNTFQNWFALGRCGGNGTLNMTGGELNKIGNGSVLVGTGFQAPAGSTPAGVLNHSGGTINCQGAFLCPENSPSSGAYNLSGTAVLNLNNWMAVGRNGGTGVMNMSGGTFTKTGNSGNHLDIGASGPGTLNQTGGAIISTLSDTWLGESGSGTWTISGGTALLGLLQIARNGGSEGILNLDGGIITVSEIAGGSGSSTLNFNGGTLQASGDNANFLHNLAMATVGAGGAVFDSQGFNVTVAQALIDFSGSGGGVTKNGNGSVALLGANYYTGPTIVNAGALTLGTFSSGAGACTVADNSALGVTVQSANGQLIVASLNLGSSAGASLNFDLGAFGNPTSAPLNVAGAWVVNGTITVHIADALPQVGQFPLVQYAARTGTGTFVLGALPVGVVANIVTNGNTIALDISSVNLPRWDGQAGGDWDIGLTMNWINIGTGLPTLYGEGNSVLFDDNALGTTTVNLAAAVNPGSVTINNNLLPYTLAGSGRISGSTGLTKTGAGTLAIVNTGGNTYTGPTVVSGGVLSVTSLANGGSPSSIGASSANPTNLVLANATLSYSGPPVTANRGFAIASTNSAIDAQSDFTLSGPVIAVPNPGIGSAFVKTGPAQFALTSVGVNEFANGYNPGIKVNMGTMLFDGSAGAQSNHTVNEIWVGGTPDSGAALILSNTTLRADSWLGLGRGNGSIGNTSSVSLYNSTLNVGNASLGYWNNLPGNYAFQTLTLNGSSTFTNRGDSNFGESGGSTATISVNGTSLLWCQNRCYLGQNGGATGTLAIANSGVMRVNNGWFSIGNGDSSSGTVLIKDNGSLFVSSDLNVTDTGISIGSLTMQDNAVASGNAVYVGKSSGSIGTVTMSGGTVIARGGDLRVGSSGTATWNQTGGTVIGTNWVTIGRNSGGVGVYNLSGGSLIKVSSANRLNVGENGTGTLTVSGSGSVVMGAAIMDIQRGGQAGVSGTVNLNGGTITVNQVVHSGTGGPATFNFNGGTLIAGAGANATFMAGLTTANVLSGGAIIDSGTNVINVNQALLDGTGGGGLTKLGAGTLCLNAVSTYTGATLVSAGALGGTGTILGPVTVASGAALAPGTASIGMLTISNSLTFSTGSSAFAKVSLDGGVASNDQVAGLTGVTYAGTLMVTNAGSIPLTVGSKFKLFDSLSAGNGNFAAVTILPAGSGTFNPATGEVTITAVPPLSVHPPIFSGGNLIMTGNGGLPGRSYTLLSTTNVALPMAAWMTNSTGLFDSAGAMSNAIPVNPSVPEQFFRVREP